MSSNTHLFFYEEALTQAEISLQEGGIPIGAVLVHNGIIIGRGYNRRIQDGSVIHHGEMNCLENSGRHHAEVYQNSVLYTTLSPCAMCTGAILLYQIPHVIIGENQNFMGCEDLLCARGVQITRLNHTKTIQMMATYIQNNQAIWHEDIGTP